jgi:type IV fimbrial biogenesis protein FimT
MKSSTGFTLHESLCVITITAILSTTAVPALQSLISSSRSKQLYYKIFTLIQYVRTKSILLYEDVILCPSTNDKDCVNDWQLPLILFIDQNKNKIRDNNEIIDRKVHLLKKGERFIWRASGTSRYLRFHTNGLTTSQNGSFIICPSSNKPSDIYKIVLYYSGRARTATPQEINPKECQ